MEFVGSIFDDTFAVQVLVGDTTVYNKNVETVNTSTWYETAKNSEGYSNIDFYGGDHTTYHTGWKTYNIDVSAYRGKTVTLSFVVYDKGDSIYDSVALIAAMQNHRFPDASNPLIPLDFCGTIVPGPKKMKMA